MIEWSDKEYVNADPQNCFCLVFVDADAEALLDGVAEVLPDGDAEVLPGGVAEVLPDGVAEVLPGGVADVRHVTGNDKDYLRKIPRVVW